MKKRCISIFLVIVMLLMTSTSVEAADTRFSERKFSIDDMGRTHGIAKVYSKEDLIDSIEHNYIPLGFYDNPDGIYEDEGDVYVITHYSYFSDYDQEENVFTATSDLNKEFLALYSDITRYLYRAEGNRVRYMVNPWYENDEDIIPKGIYVYTCVSLHITDFPVLFDNHRKCTHVKRVFIGYTHKP